VRTPQQLADQALLASIGGNIGWLQSETIGAFRWNAIVNGTAPETRMQNLSGQYGNSASEPYPTIVPWVSRQEIAAIVDACEREGLRLDAALVKASLGERDVASHQLATKKAPDPLFPDVKPLPPSPMPAIKPEADIGDVLPRPIYWAYNQIPNGCPRCGSAGHPWFYFTGMTSTGRQVNCYNCKRFTFTVLQTKPEAPPERRAHPRGPEGRHG